MTIYFISDGEFIKIGYTDRDVESRLKSLQTGNPKKLVLLGQMDGNESKEADLHEQFKALRAHGEWFKSSSVLTRYIQSVGGMSFSKRKAPKLSNNSTKTKIGQWLALDKALLTKLLAQDKLSSPEGLDKVNHWFKAVDWSHQKASNLVLRNFHSSNYNDTQKWLSEAASCQTEAFVWQQRGLRYLWSGQRSICDVQLVIDSLSEIFNIDQRSLRYENSSKWYRTYKKYFNPYLAGEEVWAQFKDYALKNYESRFVNEDNDAFLDFVSHVIAWSYLEELKPNSVAPYLRLTDEDAVSYSNLTMLGWLSHCQKRVKHWPYSSQYVSLGDFLEAAYLWGQDYCHSFDIRFVRYTELHDAQIRINTDVF